MALWASGHQEFAGLAEADKIVNMQHSENSDFK
jgi:hypothetical protein